MKRKKPFYLKVAIMFANASQRYFRKLVKLNPQIINYPALIKKTNLTTHGFDYRYKIITIKEWQEIINIFNQLMEDEPYVSDFRDCDNHAYYFTSWCGWVLKINSAGSVYGKLYHDDGRFIGGHYWNILPTKDKTYFYDPIKEKIFDFGKEAKLGDRVYKPEYSYFF